MATDAASPSVGSGSEQDADMTTDDPRSVEEKTQHAEKNDKSESTDVVEHTKENPPDAEKTVLNEDAEVAITTNENLPEGTDNKNTSTDSIIWLESSAHSATLGTDDSKGEHSKSLPAEPCELSNDGDVEMCISEAVPATVEEVMETDEDLGAAGANSDEQMSTRKSPAGPDTIVISEDPKEEKTQPTEPEETEEAEETKPQGILNAKCCNPACCHMSRELFLAPLFIQNSYEIRKKKKTLYICDQCFNTSVQQYEQLGGCLVKNEPLYSANVKCAGELVEIVDSSDEECEGAVGSEPKELSLPSDAVSLIETELLQVIYGTMEKYNFKQQEQESTKMLRDQLTRIEGYAAEADNTLEKLRKQFDEMQHALYRCVKTTIKQQLAINIIDDCTLATTMTNRVRSAVVERTPVQVHEIYFGMRGSLLGDWNGCKVLEEIHGEDNSIKFMVQFLNGTVSRAVLTAKQMAYRGPASVRLQQGMRVIAKVTTSQRPNDENVEDDEDSGFYAGIIAETLSSYNGQRYLVIFDNGYTYYALPWNVRVVCEQSLYVWEDVHPHTQEFVCDYLNNYKCVRPMVQVKKGQRMITEKDGKWRQSIVMSTDSSLVLLYFPEIRSDEWIFRGSKRLGPLFHDRNKERQQISRFQKRNIPSIEYITIEDDDEEAGGGPGENAAAPSSTAANATSPAANATTSGVTVSSPESKASLAFLRSTLSTRGTPPKRGTERPTAPATSQPVQIVMNKNIIYCDNDRPEGITNMFTTKNYRGPQRYVPHECSTRCTYPITFDLKTYNLLARPLICGWERQICKASGKKGAGVVYRAPCGRRLRCMYELHRYLRLTHTQLNVETFDFDPEIRSLATFRAQNLIYEIKDLSCGKELMPVSCVNYYDDTRPPPCEYSTKRIATDGVNLNLDDDFLCGCDCEDDCLDKSRCQCWQLTIRGALHNKPASTSIDEIGYVYKQLQDLVLTGIYECNSRCKCKVNECLNRVVQHPLQTKLQVFKTSNRGWGIRALNDVPKGSFICVYTGHLLTEEASNLICEQNEDKTGDEYFADLDYIETVEEIKDGYESEPIPPSSDSSSGSSSSDSSSGSSSSSDDDDQRNESTATITQDDSDDEFMSKSKPSTRGVNTRAKLKQNKSKSSASTQKLGTKSGSSSSGAKPGVDRERVNLIPNSDSAGTSGPSNPRRSFRQLFGEDEHPYVMDAKKTGNLGRYFNHSCVPNLFVQNVFVDTHDLRFPWVAFFASRNIQAGSELTWNYSYDVGSVPGKVLFCHCGEPECRKRLL